MLCKSLACPLASLFYAKINCYSNAYNPQNGTGGWLFVPFAAETRSKRGVTRSPVTKASVLLVFTSFIFGKYGNVTDVRFLLLPRLVPLRHDTLSVSANLRHMYV